MKTNIIIMGIALTKTNFFKTYFLEPESVLDIDLEYYDEQNIYNYQVYRAVLPIGLKQRIKFKDYHYY